jgi:hypothetical protein
MHTSKKFVYLDSRFTVRLVFMNAAPVNNGMAVGRPVM